MPRNNPLGGYRYGLQSLESRVLLSTVTWTGLGTILSDWSVGLNWSTLAPPSNGDDVVFSGLLRLGNTNNLTNLSLHSITFSGNNFVIGGNAITLASGGAGITADNNATGSNTINLAISLASTQTITINKSGATLNMAGNLGGAGGLTTAGAGEVILSGANSYNGATSVSAGTLVSGVANAIPTGSSLTVSSGGTFDMAGFAQSISSISGSGTITDTGSAATLTVNNSTSDTFDGLLSGSLSLTKTNTGTLNLTNSGNTCSGTTNINNGILNFVSGALGSGNITFGGGTLQWASGNTQDVSGKIVVSASAMVIDTNGNNVTFASVLVSSNSGGLTKMGSGVLILNAIDVYTGATAVSAGTLLVDGSTAAASGFSVASGATAQRHGHHQRHGQCCQQRTFDPGDPATSTAILHTGNLTLASGSNYTIELNGTTAGSGYDQSIISGALALGGATLNATLGFTPTVGTVFTIIHGAPAAGRHAWRNGRRRHAVCQRSVIFDFICWWRWP